MRSSFLVFGRPCIGQEEIDEVVMTMKSGWLGTGPKTHQLEKEFAEYLGVKHCIALSSCTAALHLSMLAIGIGPGDEVIVPAMTFCASANAVIHAGATPVFADCILPEVTIDPEDIKRKITSHTKAILPVHLYGRPANMEVIKNLADDSGLYVIDDAAHAIETQIKGVKMGHFGDLTCFSFYITKNMTTVEGGMIATNDDEWADRIKIYALHGMSKDAWARFSDKGYKHYQVIMPGYKYNMTDMQASLGIHQLRKIEKHLIRRQMIWEYYNKEFANLPIDLPAPFDPETRHACHLYTLQVRKDTGCSRDELMLRLHDYKIGTGVHYTALHLHPYYTSTYNYKQGDFPNCEHVGNSTLSIPLSANLTDNDINDVVEAVKMAVTG
jgi:dTDP-4-amino-4,6-dideoxygalactose transaminase